jgi:hypothetical protein
LLALLDTVAEPMLLIQKKTFARVYSNASGTKIMSGDEKGEEKLFLSSRNDKFSLREIVRGRLFTEQYKI